MKHKLAAIISKSHDLLKQYQDVWTPLGFMGKALAFFILSALLLSDFDLTHYSSAYLSRTIIIYCLVSLGVFLFFHNYDRLTQILEDYLSIGYWQIIATTLFFFPLMLLGGRKEMFFWFTPVLSMILMILWIGRWQLLSLMKPESVNYSQFWHNLKPQWTDRLWPKGRANVEIGFNYDSVLLSGAGTALGQKLLSLMAGSGLQKLVLIDSSVQNLTTMQAWVQKFLPNVQAVFLLSEGLNAQALKNVFKAYNIKYVFDLDRSFTRPHIDGVHQSLLHRNLKFPKLLLDQAVANKAKIVVSLSAIPLDDNDVMASAQSIVECYAQRLDSDKTRVIPFRIRALAEDSATQGFLMNNLLVNQNIRSRPLYVAPVSRVAVAMLTILRQLIENPAHHGVVWEVTHVYELKKLKLAREIILTDGLQDVFYKIQTALQLITPLTLASDLLFPTSQDGAAIVADYPIVETDFEKCFKDLEILMAANPELGETPKRAGKRK